MARCNVVPRDVLAPALLARVLATEVAFRHEPSCRLEPGHDGKHAFNSQSDKPFYQMANDIEIHIKNGMTCIQKFTCQECGARQAMLDSPNKCFTEGACQECGGSTDIVKSGMGYMLIATNNPGGVAALLKAIGEPDANDPKRRQ